MSDGYAPGEVVWLLEMDRWTAIACDADQRDSLAGLSEDEAGAGSSADSEVMVIARWREVQDAAVRIALGKLRHEMAMLRAQGYTEQEVGDLMGLSQPTVHRRFRATVTDLLVELGLPTETAVRVSKVSACLKCGARPRARLAEVRRKIKGGHQVLEHERTAGVCEQCMREDLLPRVLGRAA